MRRSQLFFCKDSSVLKKGFPSELPKDYLFEYKEQLVNNRWETCIFMGLRLDFCALDFPYLFSFKGF